MVREPSHIFLSGATGDFQKVRIDLSQALTRGLCKVTHQESFPQTASDTLLKLAQLVEPCGIIIHMIGENPGSIPTPEIRTQYIEVTERDGPFLANRPKLRDALGDFSTITYTQWEAYIAIHRSIPLLVYADANHASPTHPQRAHLDRLQGMARFASPFEDDSSLHRMVMADLMAYFALHLSTREISSILKPSNLPGGYIGRLFLGRDDFLKTLRQSLLGHGQATAITQKAAATGISGLGGIGKTHVAVEYAHRHREDYTALLFASADSPEKLHSSLATLCEVLHLDDNGNLLPDESVRVRAALDWLTSHSGWLLIFDNVDDEPAAKAVQEILGQLTSGNVLVTSRLHGWSDQVKNIDLEVLSETDAAELLIELTANRRRLASDDETQARQLAILLEGLPLAIHQAAGYINEQTLTLFAYVARYEAEAADLLNWFNDLSIPYERPEKLAPKPVLGTWKTSFEKLSEEDRFYLLVFSHFASDPIPEFLLEPAEDASSEEKSRRRSVRDAISHAEKYCLVSRSRMEPAFKIHSLVQQITRDEASSEERFAALNISILIIIYSGLGDPQDVRNWDKWNPLQPHLYSLCSHASDDPAPEYLSKVLSYLGILCSAKAHYSDAEKHFRRALDIDRGTLGQDHPDLTPSLNNLGLLLKTTNRLSEAEPHLREALRIARGTAGDDHPDLVYPLNNLAQTLQDLNSLTEAEQLMRESLCIASASFGEDHPKIAVCLSNLAQLLLSTSRLTESEPLMRDALRIVRAVFGDHHPQTATQLNNLAGLYLDSGRLTEAEPLFREALCIDLATYGSDHPDVGRDLNNLAQVLKKTERLSEAEPLFRESLRIARVTYKGKHPIVAKALNNLAFLLQSMNRVSEAKSLFREALSIDRANLGQDHPDLAESLRNLATLLHDGMCFSEAEQLIREALRIDRATFGENHEKVASHLNNLAQSIKATKRFAEAEPLMLEALSIDRAVLGDNHPDVARDLNNLGRLLHETNRLSEAEPLFLEALRIERAASGDEHPNVARVLNNLAQLLQATDRLADAEPLMREALRIDRAAYGKDHPTVASRLNNLAGLLIATKQLLKAEPLMREALLILHDNLGPAHPKTMGVSRNLDLLYAEMSVLPPDT